MIVYRIIAYCPGPSCFSSPMTNMFLVALAFHGQLFANKATRGSVTPRGCLVQPLQLLNHLH